MRDEGTLFSLVAQLMTLNDDDFKQYFQQVWWPNATDEDMQGLMELYVQDPTQGSPYEVDGSNLLSTVESYATLPNFKRLASVVGDYSFEAQRRNLLNHWNFSTPVWNYIHDQSVPSAGLLNYSDVTKVPVLGSFHASDVWFNVFGQIPSTLSKNTLYRQATIISFVRNLEPNSHGLNITYWPEYTREKLETYRFMENGPEVVKDDYRMERMQYINDHPDSFLI